MDSILQIRQKTGIHGLIHLVRAQRVMLDGDLARIYGVSTKQLNQQLRRNLGRFPIDFAFQLTTKELSALDSQESNGRAHGGRRYRPYVFTEHGAIMLASVLNSPTAIEASVRVVRAFVFLREQLAANDELASKLTELERRLGAHDQAITTLFEAIKQLLEPPTPAEKRREMGFHIKEEARKYRVRNGA